MVCSWVCDMLSIAEARGLPGERPGKCRKFFKYKSFVLHQSPEWREALSVQAWRKKTCEAHSGLYQHCPWFVDLRCLGVRVRLVIGWVPVYTGAWYYTQGPPSFPLLPLHTAILPSLLHDLQAVDGQPLPCLSFPFSVPGQGCALVTILCVM